MRFLLTLRLAPVVILAVGVALLGGVPRHAGASDDLVFSVSFLPQEPACNGDSVRVTLNIKQADGSPAAGEQAIIVGVDNLVALPHGEPGTQAEGVTDKRGNFQVDLTPPAGTHDSSPFVVGTFGSSGSAHQFRFVPCPFSSDRAVVVAGTIWNDRDGDGLQSARETSLAGRTAGIYGGCYGPGCFVPLHWTRTDPGGQFEWRGLHQFDAGAGDTRPPFPTWNICVPEDSRAVSAISLNGVRADVTHAISIFGIPEAPAACVYLGKLQPGVNNFSVGVQYSPKK